MFALQEEVVSGTVAIFLLKSCWPIHKDIIELYSRIYPKLCFTMIVCFCFEVLSLLGIQFYPCSRNAANFC